VEKPRPYWLWPNLLSLDAPIVAVVWAWIFAETWRVQWINSKIFYVLPGIVWIIYVLDRVLDNQSSKGVLKSSRHEFHAENWDWLKFAVFAVGGFCLAMAILLPKGIIWHVTPILIFVCIYFFLAIFYGGTTSHGSFFKNMVAGYTFSYGVAMGVHFFRPSVTAVSLMGSQEMITFGILCICNITAIDLWEASRTSEESDEKGYYELLLTVPLLGLVLVSLYLALKGDEYARPFYFAVMIASGLLQIINQNRSKFSLDTQRALADAALIAPAPIFWLYLQYLG